MHTHGQVKNHIAKLTFKQYFESTKHKGRKIPLHPVDKVEELNKIIDDKQIIQLERFTRIFYQSCSNYGQK